MRASVGNAEGEGLSTCTPPLLLLLFFLSFFLLLLLLDPHSLIIMTKLSPHTFRASLFHYRHLLRRFLTLTVFFANFVRGGQVCRGIISFFYLSFVFYIPTISKLSHQPLLPPSILLGWGHPSLSRAKDCDAPRLALHVSTRGPFPNPPIFPHSPPPPPSPQHYYTMEQIFLILSWSPGIFSVLLSSQVDSFHHCDAGRWNERWRLWPRAMSLLMLQNTAT